jgi:hypothetical protein
MHEKLSLSVPEQLPPNQIDGTALGGLKRFLKFRHKQSGVAVLQDILPDAQIMDYETEAKPPSDSYQFLTEQLSDDALVTNMHELEAEMNRSPELSKLHKINTAIAENAADGGDAYRLNDKEAAAQLDNEYDELRSEKSLFLDEARSSITAWEDKLYRLKERKSVILEPQESAAQILLGYLGNAEPIQEVVGKNAPFAHHQENSDESWQVVDDQDVRDYLNNRKFIDIAHNQVESGSVVIKGEKDSPLEVPLNLLVGAAGFDSWTGRDSRYGKDWSSKYGAGNMKSLDVIKHYAGLSSEVPAVGEIRVFIQPNGIVLCDNGAGDSHRIAAAILQGQEFIKADSLEFVRLKENLI